MNGKWMNESPAPQPSAKSVCFWQKSRGQTRGNACRTGSHGGGFNGTDALVDEAEIGKGIKRNEDDGKCAALAF